MTAAQLVIYLTQLSSQELRIDFARQILAKNMNFSPAWIISVLKQASHSEAKEFTVSNLDTLLRIIEMPITNNDIVALFQYFDIKKHGKIQFTDFIDSLLPINNEALKNAVVKRIPNDIQFSFELKYAIKRLFMQILQTQKTMKSYSITFPQLSVEDFGDKIQKQKIKQLLQKYGKYPTEAQINVLDKMIRDNKIKGVNAKQIKHIIKDSQKLIKQVIENKQNKQMLLPSSLITFLPPEQSSPIKRINEIKNSSPIKKLSINENQNQTVKTPIKSILKSNYKQTNRISENAYLPINQNKLISKYESQQYPRLQVARTTSILQTPQQYHHKTHNNLKTGSSKEKHIKQSKQKIIKNKNKTPEKNNQSQQLNSKKKSTQKVRSASKSISWKSDEKQKKNYIDLLIKNNKQMDLQLQTIRKNNKKRSIQMRQDIKKLSYK